MAGDSVVMPQNAFLMIHDPSGLVMGTAEDMRSTAEALDKVKGSLIQGYATKSGKPDAEIAALMAAETWLDAQDALALGLIDRIAEPVKLAASFDIARFRNAPAELTAAVSDASDEPLEAAADDPAPETPDADAGPNAGQTSVEHAPSPTPISTTLVTSAAPDAIAIRAEAIAHARVVIDLCRLAGQPQMAGRFLEEDAGLDEVRTRLLAAKAEATPDITAAHAQPGRAAATNPWGEVIARTFKTKG
jgi:enoyl-CoA hydratase/carnithine racemase